jgi:hypothetical protein
MVHAPRKPQAINRCTIVAKDNFSRAYLLLVFMSFFIWAHIAVEYSNYIVGPGPLRKNVSGLEQSETN